MATGTRAGSVQLAEDRALVERLLAGDQTAYDRFFEDYFGGLYRFALTRLGFDEELAREIVQSTVATAIERLDAYRGEGALFTWLCGICRNEIRGHFRRLRRAPVEVELVEDTPEIRAVLDALAAGAGGPEEELQNTEVARLVHLTLDHLPPRYGRALEWKYIEGLSVREIAARLGISAKAAESILTRSREAFRTGFTALSEGVGEGFRGLRLVTSGGAG